MGREVLTSYPEPDFPSLGTGMCCFSSALAVCGSYTSKISLFLIRTHIYGKLSQVETPEKLVLGKLRTFASSYWNMQVSNQLGESNTLIQRPSAGLAVPSLEFGPCPFFFFHFTVLEM